MSRNIELIRYKQFGSDLILFELVNATSNAAASRSAAATRRLVEPIQNDRTSRGQTDKTAAQWFETMSADTRALFDSLEGFIASHWGTGDYEVVLRNHADFDKVKPLLQKAYEG